MRKSVFLKTYGCTLNQADAELLEGALLEKGFSIADSERSSDFIIISTCGVKEATENKILDYLKRIRSLGKPIVVSGCLPSMDLRKLKKAIPDAIAYVGPNSIRKIPEMLVSEAKRKNNVVSTGSSFPENVAVASSDSFSEKFNMTPFFRFPTARVEIASGCLSNCSFCGTKLARGKFLSKPVPLIKKEVEVLVGKGAKEILLCAQDTACYGFDSKTNVAELLKELNSIPGDFMMRLGMGSPNHFLKFLPSLSEALQLPKVYKFLHIPVQSGSDAVLKKMKRNYSVSECRKIISHLRRKVPDLTIATDMIVGFPGETDEQFSESMNLIKELQFNIVNVSKFSARAGTPACKLTQIHSKIVKTRSMEMSALARKISKQKNAKWIGWKGEIVLLEKGKDNSIVGRNYAYKNVGLKKTKGKIGEKKKVRISGAEITHLIGEVI